MTETIDTAQPEALRLADLLFTAAAGSDAGIYTGTMRAAAAELRRLQNTLEMAVSDAQRSWRELAAAEARNATLTDDAAPADPMDWRLPCDVTVGHGTMRKGVKLRTLVTRMKVLYEMATGNNADEVANRTPEQNAALANAFQARAAASISTKGDGHGN